MGIWQVDLAVGQDGKAPNTSFGISEGAEFLTQESCRIRRCADGFKTTCLKKQHRTFDQTERFASMEGEDSYKQHAEFMLSFLLNFVYFVEFQQFRSWMKSRWLQESSRKHN